MEANIMSLNKTLAGVVCSTFGFIACASTSHRFECPSALSDGRQSYVLDNASLFDGPPEQLADLIPVQGKTADRWDLTGVDPYLVCRYKGTDKVVTMHVKDARACEATSHPFAAYCIGH